MENASEDPVVVERALKIKNGLLNHMNKYLSISNCQKKESCKKEKKSLLRTETEIK